MVPFYIGEPGHVERTYGQLVSGNYFAALGLTPTRGRFFRPDETNRPGSEPVAVISSSLWQSRYGSAADTVGRTIRVNGRDLTIIGIAPRRFQGTMLGLSFDLWVPATMAPALIEGSTELQNRSGRGYQAMGRLGEGATDAMAQSEVDRVMAQLAEEFPETNRRVRAEGYHVLAGAARSSTSVCGSTRRSSGGDAAAPARRLRQHRESRARAGQRADTRDGNQAGTRCFAVACGPVDAVRERPALDCRRSVGLYHRDVVDPDVDCPAAHWSANPVSNSGRCGRARVCDRPGDCVRGSVWRRSCAPGVAP